LKKDAQRRLSIFFQKKPKKKKRSAAKFADLNSKKNYFFLPLTPPKTRTLDNFRTYIFSIYSTDRPFYNFFFKKISPKVYNVISKNFFKKNNFEISH